VLRKTLKRDQQEGLTRLWRNLRQMPFDWLAGIGDTRLSVDANRIPYLCEEPVEGNPCGKPGVEHFRILDQCFQRCRYVGIAGSLTTRKRARIAPQVRQMLSNC